MPFVNTADSYNSDQECLDDLIAHSSSLTVFKDDRVAELGNYALYMQSKLQEVDFPNCTKIGSYAFQYCSNLEEVDFSNCTSIGSNAFQNCSNLETIRIGGKLTSLGNNAFKNCPKLKALLLENTSGVSAASSSIWNGTNFLIDEAAIYVPTDLVASYKSNSNYAKVKGCIFPLSDYPLSDFSSVSDSWSTIIAKAANGTHSSSYTIGDTKKVTYGDKSVYMQYAYDRPEGPVWIVKNFAETHNYNDTMMAYDGSALDTYMNTTIYGLLPNELQSAIAEVPITYYDAATNETKSINRKVWALSSKEAGFTGTNCKEDSGYAFSDLFTSNNSTRIKYNMSTGSVYDWWLRSSYNAYSPVYVGNDGAFFANAPSTVSGVVFGFVLSGPSS